MATLSQKETKREAKLKALIKIQANRRFSTSELVDQVREDPNPGSQVELRDNGSTTDLRKSYEEGRWELVEPVANGSTTELRKGYEEGKMELIDPVDNGSTNDLRDVYHGPEDAEPQYKTTPSVINNKDLRQEVNHSDETLKPIYGENDNLKQYWFSVPVKDLIEANKKKDFRQEVNHSDETHKKVGGEDLKSEFTRPSVNMVPVRDPYSVNHRQRPNHHDDDDNFLMYGDGKNTRDLRGTQHGVGDSPGMLPEVNSDTHYLRERIGNKPGTWTNTIGFGLGHAVELLTDPLNSKQLQGFIKDLGGDKALEVVDGIDNTFKQIMVSPLNKLWRVRILTNRLKGSPKCIIKRRHIALDNSRNQHRTRDGSLPLPNNPASAELYSSLARKSDFIYVPLNGTPRNWFRYRMTHHGELEQRLLTREAQREPTSADLKIAKAKRADKGLLGGKSGSVKTPEPIYSPVNNVVSIMNLSTSDLRTITLQHRPTDLEINPESDWVSVKSMGRNNPFLMYTGGDDKISFEITWFSTENPDSVINSCRLLESWARADGYRKAPPLLRIIWGTSGLFDNKVWVLESAPYKLSNFRNGYRKPRGTRTYSKDNLSSVDTSQFFEQNVSYLKDPGNFVDTKLYPGYAKQTLTFRLVTKNNRRHLNFISDKDVEKLLNQQANPHNRRVFGLNEIQPMSGGMLN